MSFSISFRFIVRVLGLTGGLAVAAEAADAPLRLTDALARAAERNPSLAAQAYAERSAEALIEQAGLRPVPTLDLAAENFAGTGTHQGVRSLEATVQASQAIERGDKRQKRVAVATRDRDVAARDYAVKKAEVLGAAAIAYVETLAAQQRAALAEESVALARDTLQAAEARVKAGAGSPAEAARARTALALAQGELSRARAELAAARARLAATWGGAASEVPMLAGALQVPEAPVADTTLLPRIAGHPRLALQQSIVASRRAALDLERAQASQDLTVSGGVRFLREGSDAALVAGLSVPLPSRNRNLGGIRAARENLAGAEQTARALEAGLRTEFSLTWQEAAAAQAAAQALRRDALPAAQEAQTIVRRAYDEGQLPLIDVLDAQRELIALRRELLELEAKFATAHARAEALLDPNLPATATLLSLP